MALNRDFKETVKARAVRDPGFRVALIQEAVDCILADDWDTARSLIRRYINAASSYDEVGEKIGKHTKSVIRMLGSGGNPSTANLLGILKFMQEREGVRLSVNNG